MKVKVNDNNQAERVEKAVEEIESTIVEKCTYQINVAKKEGMRKDYDVNTMPIEEMDEIIETIKKDHKEKEASQDKILCIENEKIDCRESISKESTEDNMMEDKTMADKAAINVQMKSGEQQQREINNVDDNPKLKELVETLPRK